MSEKRLFQCDWSRGQTDGDPVPGTVRRILNMEMSEPGIIKTRKAFGSHSISMGNCGSIAKMDYSPEWSNADAWLFAIHLNSIMAIPIIGGGLGSVEYLSIPGLGTDFVDLAKSQITVAGDKAVVLIVKSGENDGEVFIVQSLTGLERFRAPFPHAGTSLDPSYSVSTTGWTVYNAKATAPNLVSSVVKSYEFLDDNHTGEARILPYTGKANEYHWPTNKADVHGRYYAALSSLSTQVQSEGQNTVGLIAIVAAPDDDLDGEHSRIASQPEGIYGRSAIVEYRVQYLYYSGQMSQLSRPVRVNDWDNFEISDTEDESVRYQIGVGLIVPTSIGREVKGINIYRQNIETGNTLHDPESEPQLIGTYWIDSEILEDSEIDLGEFDLNIGGEEDYQQSLRYGYLYQSGSMDLAKPYACWYWMRYSIAPELYAFWPSPQYRRLLSSSGECRKTSGWVKVSSGCAMYMDTHYASDCPLTLRLYGPGSYIIDTTVNCVLASRYNGSSGVSNSMIRFGCSMPLSGIREIAAPTNKPFICYGRPLGSLSVNTIGFTTVGGGMPLDGVAAFRTHSSAVVASQGVDVGYEAFGSGPISEEKIPFIGLRDIGDTPVDSESSFIGATSESLVEARPIAIAVTGGRLLGAGGRFDGQRYPTRVWYSLFQNFGFVTDASYLDYGARGDGFVVGISSYKSRILLHFSSATYVIDASGGFDMSWRELGAISNVGLLNRNAVTETPIGNVWASKGGVYIFNGRGINEITHMPETGVSVRSTYKELISGSEDSVRAFYRSDLQQVWISVGHKALVWNIETGAWHERQIDEILVSGWSPEILGFLEIGGVQNLVALMNGSIVRLHPETDSEQSIVFEWGLDVLFDAGAVEVVKKTKRFYVDAFTGASNKRIEVSVSSQGGPEASQMLVVPRGPDVENVTVFSSSTRGRRIEITLRNEGPGWSATINGLGMSHKLKPLK